ETALAHQPTQGAHLQVRQDSLHIGPAFLRSALPVTFANYRRIFRFRPASQVFSHKICAKIALPEGNAADFREKLNHLND
ncbi:MAG: hypothetical protein KC450_12950, partial [Lentibacter algarum]|uniref:hypothetical protein n=1 Tax=Lentibacter algarum TaxID=576131 RepID=UPI002354BBC2